MKGQISSYCDRILL